MSFQRRNGSLFSSCAMYWEYDLLVVVVPFLPLTFSQIFKDATLFFLRSTLNLATVIPAMDHIDTHLATASQNLKYSPAIRASLALRKAHLNKYYDMTDYSEVYRIAMSECSLLIILFNYNSVEQSYIHDTNFNISARLTGMPRGSPPRLQLSMMSLCEHMRTSPSMRSSSFARRMYVCPSGVFILHRNSPRYVFRLLGPRSGTSLMICHRSLPLLPPSSRTSSNNTLGVLSRTSRMHSHGGSRTEQSTPVSLEWH